MLIILLFLVNRFCFVHCIHYLYHNEVHIYIEQWLNAVAINDDVCTSHYVLSPKIPIVAAPFLGTLSSVAGKWTYPQKRVKGALSEMVYDSSRKTSAVKII